MPAIAVTIPSGDCLSSSTGPSMCVSTYPIIGVFLISRDGILSGFSPNLIIASLTEHCCGL